MIKKCNNNIRFLWRTAKDLSFSNRKLLASALVGCHLNYCDTVYHLHISKELSNRLNSIQYKLLRFICGTRRQDRVSAASLRKKLDWTTLDNLREAKMNTVIWRTQNDLDCPRYLVDCIYRSNSNTRYHSQGQRILNAYGRKTLNAFFCKNYLALPISVRNHQTEGKFFAACKKLA